MKKITFFSLVTFLLLFCSITTINGQSTDTDFNAGAAVIDMGISPQTDENGLIPYGLVVALVDAGIPVNWIINDSNCEINSPLHASGKSCDFIICYVRKT